MSVLARRALAAWPRTSRAAYVALVPVDASAGEPALEATRAAADAGAGGDKDLRFALDAGTGSRLLPPAPPLPAAAAAEAEPSVLCKIDVVRFSGVVVNSDVPWTPDEEALMQTMVDRWGAVMLQKSRPRAVGKLEIIAGGKYSLPLQVRCVRGRRAWATPTLPVSQHVRLISSHSRR